MRRRAGAVVGGVVRVRRGKSGETEVLSRWDAELAVADDELEAFDGVGKG